MSIINAKSIFSAAVIALMSLTATAQTPRESKFKVIVSGNEPQSTMKYNAKVAERKAMIKNQAESQGRDLLKSLADASGNTFVGGIVGVSTNLIKLGVDNLVKSTRDQRPEWYKAAKAQCRFYRKLQSNTQIDDFYFLPSVEGAMDPSNLKFKGFGCHNYLAEKGEAIDDVFYVYCSIKLDDEGIDHIVRHSKFVVEVDSLVFIPTNCNLPNDSTGLGGVPFDFDRRKNLEFNLKATFYSTWINEAIMVNDNQKIGEFNITATIDPRKVKDGRFVYDKNDPDFIDLVKVSGDCFMVPRSFTGTTDAKNYVRAWGTGQYRVDMEVTESCDINDDTYMTVVEGKYDEQGRPMKKWDKKKWGPEWKAMKKARKNQPTVMDEIWQTVSARYNNGNWIAVFTEPITQTIISAEKSELDKALGLTPAPKR